MYQENQNVGQNAGQNAASQNNQPVDENAGGSPHEDARQHIHRARAWLSGVPAGSMESWVDLCRSFLMRYNPPNMHTQLRNDIASFRQADDESMHECWDRFKGLLRKCTNHRFQDWTQVVMFYNGVNAPTRMMLDASANGTLLDKSLEEAFDILDRVASNDYQFPTTRLGAGRRAPGMLDVDANDSVSAQLSAITHMLKNLQKPTDVRDAKAVSCVHCEGKHHANDCPTMYESANYVGNYNRNATNPYSNTYNPGWRQHPNFSWGNQGGGNTSNANRQQNSHGSSLRALENQVGQIAQALQARPHGSLPRDTEVTRRNGKEECSALTLRSGTPINKNVQPRGDENTEASPVIRQEESEMQEEAREEEDAAARPVPIQETEEVRLLPPFPQRLKTHKEDNQFKRFVDMLDQLHIDVPFLEAIDQMPTYAKFLKDIITKKRKIERYETVATAGEYFVGSIPPKKNDPGSFIIPCSIGDNYLGKALCDLGSSVNLMPKSVFMKLGIGTARPTTVILQLADRSHVKPEGKVDDLLVKVGKFVFPAHNLGTTLPSHGKNTY
ncbi:hypothetical protein GQ457_03G020300 [Hibiscus cannabinus]